MAALGLGLIGVVGRFALELWQFLGRNTLSIDATRVRYKGRSLPRAEVDEIVNAGGIAIFAGRRQIELPVGFSEIAATPALLAELRRLILPPGR